jgi:VanZ like family
MVISGTLLIWTIKWGIRPYVDAGAGWQFFLGIAPNLLGCFLLPFGAHWFFERIFRFQTIQHLRLACTVGFILVVMNEFIQIIPVFGRTFDWNDIVFSVLGTSLGYKAFYSRWMKQAVALT